MQEPVPFQVQLERHQHRRLKHLAERRGRSMAALIRESVEAYLVSVPVEDDPALEIIGILGDDQGTHPHGDVARNHDDYLADYLEQEAAPAQQRDERPRSSQ